MGAGPGRCCTQREEDPNKKPVVDPNRVLTKGEEYMISRLKQLDETYASGNTAIAIVAQPIADSGAGIFGEYIGDASRCKLTTIELRKTEVSAIGFTAVVQSLAANNLVTSFRYIDNGIAMQVPFEKIAGGAAYAMFGTEGAEQLATILKSNPTLTELVLENNSLSNAGCQVIFKALESNKTLRLLALRKNMIKTESCPVIAAALPHNSSCSTIDLQENQIDDKGGAILAKALETNTSIVDLNLRANEFSAKIGASLATALKANKTLLYLNLRRNKLMCEGCAVLAEALETNRTLRCLHLASNLIADAGAIQLAASLEKNVALETLSLEINQIRDSGVICIGSALEKNRSLRVLDLRMNGFGKTGLERVREAVQQNQTIRRIDLSDSLMDCKKIVGSIQATLENRKANSSPSDWPNDPTCPKGHNLVRFTTQVAGNASATNGKCQICGKAVAKGDFLFGCRICDFDKCALCFQAALQPSSVCTSPRGPCPSQPHMMPRGQQQAEAAETVTPSSGGSNSHSKLQQAAQQAKQKYEAPAAPRQVEHLASNGKDSSKGITDRIDLGGSSAATTFSASLGRSLPAFDLPKLGAATEDAGSSASWPPSVTSNQPRGGASTVSNGEGIGVNGKGIKPADLNSNPVGMAEDAGASEVVDCGAIPIGLSCKRIVPDSLSGMPVGDGNGA